MLSSPAALWIPNAWCLRGWQGRLLLLPAPHSISVLIHYLWRIGTHMPRNTHSPIFNFLLPHRSFRVADKPECCQSTRPLCQCCSWPLTSLNPHTAVLTPGLFWLQVSRGHEGAGCCSEQLKQIWAKKSRMAPAGSASLTSPATSSFATTTTGYATSTSVYFYFDKNSHSGNMIDILNVKSSFNPNLAKKSLLNLEKIGTIKRQINLQFPSTVNVNIRSCLR